MQNTTVTSFSLTTILTNIWNGDMHIGTAKNIRFLCVTLF